MPFQLHIHLGTDLGKKLLGSQCTPSPMHIRYCGKTYLAAVGWRIV